MSSQDWPTHGPLSQATLPLLVTHAPGHLAQQPRLLERRRPSAGPDAVS